MPTLPQAIKLYKGLSIYRVKGSPFWYVRIWDRRSKKYVVKSTGEESSLMARDVAQDLALALLKKEKVVEAEYTFKHFALKMLHTMQREAQLGNKSAGYVRSLLWAVQNEDWGLHAYFGDKDVRTLKTASFQEYLAELAAKRPDITSSTKNTLMAAFRNVLKVARDEGVIDIVPSTPRAKQRDNPRPFFRFHPLVNKEDDAYKKLLAEAKVMAGEGIAVRGIPVTDELYDIVMFVTHSFVRPITTELYAIKHSDVVIADDPKRLVVTVRDGKTGFRSANTMPAAVAVYDRIRQRHEGYEPDDYIFFPQYKNRMTASKVVQRQFHTLMERAGVEVDQATGRKLTMYSLRHTAICMRIILSHGKVNIFNLAKNAGTSVDQIERFYARFLPLSKEMALNLQSFGGQEEP